MGVLFHSTPRMPNQGSTGQGDGAAGADEISGAEPAAAAAASAEPKPEEATGKKKKKKVRCTTRVSNLHTVPSFAPQSIAFCRR